MEFKKYSEWVKARSRIIKRAISEGRITLSGEHNIFGRCEDCQRWLELSPDHRRKQSQGGPDSYENIDWVCWECHNKRDNMNDPKKKKIKKQRPRWMLNHICVMCGYKCAQLLCPKCGRVSVKF